MGKKTKLVSAVGIAAGAAYLSKGKNRQKVKDGIDKSVGKTKSWTKDTYIINLGKPEEPRDSNMVDEGAMTSVQYYNDLREEKSTE